MPTKFHPNGTTQNFKSRSRDSLSRNFAFLSLLPFVMNLLAKFDIVAMCCKVISYFAIFAGLDLRVGGCCP